MSKDSFWTREYKGHYIHGHYDRDLKKEVITVQVMNKDKGFTLYDAKSMRAAKYKITRFFSQGAGHEDRTH